MSLLSAILQVTDETNRNDFKVQFKDVSRRTSLFVDNVKHFTTDVKEVLESRFVDYIPLKSLDYIHFVDRKTKLQKECAELQGLIDKILENNSLNNPKFKALYEEFNLTTERFKFISDLGVCCKELEVSSRFLERRRYKEAAEILLKLIEILNRPISYKDMDELVMYMKEGVSFKHVKCLYNITEQWRERLKWSENATNKGKLIVIEINITDPENLQDILNALFSSKRINVELMRFADFVTKTLTPALLTKDCSVTVRENLHQILFEVEYAERENVKENLDIKTILRNLITFFETVQSNIDCRWDDNRTVFSILGQIMGKEFFEMLKENCLQNLVTSEECKADIYQPIAAEIEKFSNYLCEINFTDKESSPLTVFVNDTHNLICEKRCKVVLGLARELMKTNLQQDIVEICTNQTLELCLDEIKMLENDDGEGRNIADCPFLLPRCSISLSAKKLLQLVLGQLDLAHNSTPVMASKIVVTVRNIFELYSALVPVYHEDVLKNNALDLGLFYNNCFYLSHGMLGHPWSCVYEKEFAARLTTVLADLVQSMRRIAIVKLASFVKEQKSTIKQLIAKSELRNWSPLEGDDSVRACLELVDRLARLWAPVLPGPVFHRTLGDVVDCLADGLVSALLRDDWSQEEEMASSVADLYQPVLEKIPPLFGNAGELEKQSRNWVRLTELVSVLKSPITAVACRCSRPGSALLEAFSKDELLLLVRVLFPHSPHKASVLEMIRGVE